MLLGHDFQCMVNSTLSKLEARTYLLVKQRFDVT